MTRFVLPPLAVAPLARARNEDNTAGTVDVWGLCSEIGGTCLE